MTKPLDRERFKREATKREDRDDITMDDLSDALKAVMAGPQQTPPEKREPTSRERKTRSSSSGGIDRFPSCAKTRPF